jgi:predicted acyltransferase
VKLFNRSYLRLVGVGVVMFLVGLGIGGTQGERKTVLNTVSAILLTLGVLVVLAALILGVVRRTKRAAV